MCLQHTQVLLGIKQHMRITRCTLLYYPTLSYPTRCYMLSFNTAHHATPLYLDFMPSYSNPHTYSIASRSRNVQFNSKSPKPDICTTTGYPGNSCHTNSCRTNRMPSLLLRVRGRRPGSRPGNSSQWQDPATLEIGLIKCKHLLKTHTHTQLILFTAI